MGLGGKAHDVFVSNIAQFTDHQTGTKINTTPAALFVNSLITWRGSKREVRLPPPHSVVCINNLLIGNVFITDDRANVLLPLGCQLPSEFPMSYGSLHVTMTVLVFHLRHHSDSYLPFLLLCNPAKIGMKPCMWKIKIPNTRTIALTTNLTGRAPWYFCWRWS